MGRTGIMCYILCIGTRCFTLGDRHWYQSTVAPAAREPHCTNSLHSDYVDTPRVPSGIYSNEGSYADQHLHDEDGISSGGRHKLKYCPISPDPLGVHRVDCFPEGGANNATCRARGCCYDDSIPEESRVPACFFPEHYGYHTDQQPRKEGNTWSGILHRYDTPTLYGGDIDTLALLVEEQTNNRLRIKLYDPMEARSEVPLTRIPNPGTEPKHALYRVEFSLSPFSVRVVRKSTNESIFDSSMGGMVFSDQYLQLSTRLASPHVYGLGEHVHTNGIKHDMDWRTWAIHAVGKHPTGPDAMNLYGSHPVYLNLENNSGANMVMLLNQHAMDVVLQPTPAVTFRTIGGILDFYVFLSDDAIGADESGHSASGDQIRAAIVKETGPISVIQYYLQAVGLPMMPPYWALGHQLSRWNYTNSGVMWDVIKRNRKAAIPNDIQWGDIDNMSNCKPFTIDEQNYSNLTELVSDLHDHHQKFIAIHPPGISYEPGGVYAPLDSGSADDIWIKHSDGTPLIGKIRAGPGVFPDFTNPRTTEWWKRHITAFYKQLPFDGFWLDVNEPAHLSDTHGSTRGCPRNKWNNPPYVPKVTARNLCNRTLCMDAVQAIGRHYDLHSLYGHFHIVATRHAGEEIYGRDKRLFIVSRSTFVGSGQFAGTWLGDNKSRFSDMKWSITGMIEMNIFGFPYVGADICGLSGDTDEELCRRWYQLGAFYPMSRNHARGDTRHQDPASFSEGFIESTRAVLLTRYRLLPYLYTLFHLAHTQGSPVIRPLAFEFPLDDTALSIDRQFLWGQCLLISPVLTNNTDVITAYFPYARWFDYFTGAEVKTTGQWLSLSTPLDQINLHLRGGHVIPQQEPANTTYHSRQNPLSLIVTLDASLEAKGMLFWDDGEMRDSHTRKDCRIVHFVATKNTLVINTDEAEGHMSPVVRIETLMIYGLSNIGIMSAQVISYNSTSDSIIHRRIINQIESNLQTQVLVLKGLSLDLKENHLITWDEVSEQ